MRLPLLGVALVLLPLAASAQATGQGTSAAPPAGHPGGWSAGSAKVEPSQAGGRAAEANQRPYVTATFGQFRLRSSFFDGNTLAASVAVGTFVSPRVSLELEVARPGSFPTNVERHAPVDISDDLRKQLAAGELEALMQSGRTEELGRVAYSAAGLVGFHPKPWGRVRLGLRAGLGVQHLAWSQTQYVVVVHAPGSYTLQAEPSGSNDRLGMKLVVGIEGAIAVTRRLAIVPEIRVHLPLGYSDSALRPAIGARWTF